jgi:post-segregation antitoxin (ccd killing protein)
LGALYPDDSCYLVVMEVNTKIPEEIAAQAKARGIRVEAYVEELLAQQAAAHSPEKPRFQSSAEVRSWLNSLAQFSDKLPPLPETISREWIYQEHD